MLALLRYVAESALPAPRRRRACRERPSTRQRGPRLMKLPFDRRPRDVYLRRALTPAPWCPERSFTRPTHLTRKGVPGERVGGLASKKRAQAAVDRVRPPVNTSQRLL